MKQQQAAYNPLKYKQVNQEYSLEPTLSPNNAKKPVRSKVR